MKMIGEFSGIALGKHTKRHVVKPRVSPLGKRAANGELSTSMLVYGKGTS